MRRFLSLVLSVALVVSAMIGPVPPASAAGAAVGQIRGVATTLSGQYLAGQLARLRSLEVGHIAGVATTSTSGRFSFDGLVEGSYVVELLSNGFVVGTSAPVVLSARDMTADGVTAMARGGAQAQAGALAGSFWGSTIGIITVAAVTAAVITTVVVVKDDESPVR